MSDQVFCLVTDLLAIGGLFSSNRNRNLKDC